jgi:hypothetical protein
MRGIYKRRDKFSWGTKGRDVKVIHGFRKLKERNDVCEILFYLFHIAQQRLRSWIGCRKHNSYQGLSLVEAGLDSIYISLGRSTLSRRTKKGASCGNQSASRLILRDMKIKIKWEMSSKYSYTKSWRVVERPHYSQRPQGLTHEFQALHNFYRVYQIQSVHICTWTCDTDHKLKW